jgi:hypothetical protein
VGNLYLIRHGQASFGAADYDVLSPVGERQSLALGEHLPNWAAPGPLRRWRPAPPAGYRRLALQACTPAAASPGH